MKYIINQLYIFMFMLQIRIKTKSIKYGITKYLVLKKAI